MPIPAWPIDDVRYGLRLIRKAPGFSAVAIASLAVGIGASTVLFSVANSLLLRPLHADRPTELIQIFTSDFSGPLYGGSSYADYESFQELPVFKGLLAWMRVKATLSDDGQANVIDGLLVSGNYFNVLGLRASRGRFFGPEESQTRGTHPVTVLSHHAWRRRFGADPAIVGRIDLRRAERPGVFRHWRRASAICRHGHRRHGRLFRARHDGGRRRNGTSFGTGGRDRSESWAG
jgi:MacB-like periplasmic core domain